MARRASYSPGTFSWVELITTDAAASAAFYEGLFGWRTDADGVFRLGGDAVAGIARGNGPLSGWLNAVTVADTDAGLVMDPQGAVLALRGPTARAAERVNEIGALCMNELLTPDLDAASAHYADALGWTTEAFGTGMRLVYNRGAVNASMIATDAGPARWRPCFVVASPEAALRRVEELGGRIVSGPIEIPDGVHAVAADPHGNEFSLFHGQLDS